MYVYYMSDTKSILKEEFKSLMDRISNLLSNYHASHNIITELVLKKSVLINNNSNQSKDDIRFYNSIFDDTIFFMKRSLDVREKKFLFDFLDNLRYLDKSLSNSTYIRTIETKYFIKLFNKIVESSNKNNYKWVKNDKKKYLNEWLLSLRENIEYHEEIFSNINSMLSLNKNFFNELNDKLDSNNDDFN